MTTPQNQKLPQAGEYWAYNTNPKCRRFIIGPNHQGNMVCVSDRGEYEVFDEQGNMRVKFWHHLPECDSFDWVPETWPKYWDTYDRDEYAFVRQASMHEFMLVKVNGDEVRPTHISVNGRNQITEAEAKARITLTCLDCGEPASDDHADVCPMAWVEIDKAVYPDHEPRKSIDVLLAGCDANTEASGRSAVGAGMHWSISHSTWNGWKFVCRRKDLPPVPEPVKAKKRIPLRVFVASDLVKHEDCSRWLMVSQNDISKHSDIITEVHGLNIFIEESS